MTPSDLRSAPPVHLCLVLGLLGLSLCAGCAAGRARHATGVVVGWDAVASPSRAVEVRYSLQGQEGAEPPRGRVDVISAGSSHVRLHLRVPGVAESVYVYDGHRLLVHDTGSPASYRLYPAAGGRPEALAAVRSWRLDPAGGDFARLCKGAERMAREMAIAGRTAVGYHCGAPKRQHGGERTLWLDRETGVLLKNDAFRARAVNLSPEVDASTFSTDLPPGAELSPSGPPAGR
jgi:hypothetical protein